MNEYALFCNTFSYEQNAFHSLYFYFGILKLRLLREQVLKAFELLSFKLVNEGIFRFSNRANDNFGLGSTDQALLFVSIGSWTSQLPCIRFPSAAWEGFVEINSTMWRTGNSPENPGAGFILAANFPSDPNLVTLPPQDLRF